MKSVYIVDAYSQIYRWYHAMPASFTAPDGMPVNAIFGIAKFLFQIEKNFTIDGGVFAFDKGGSVLRSEILKEYKSNRPPMPDDLRVQIDPIIELIDAFGWARLVSEGYEADDVIATLVKRHPDTAFKILTSDKDISQLVENPRVQLLAPSKTHPSGWIALDENGVREKYGVPPAKIVDYLALIGDSIDVIPGVPGVGPKTAVQLIETHGSILEMIAAPEKIANEKLRAKIIEHTEILKRNIRLIELNCEVPNLPETESLCVTSPHRNETKLFEIFKRYNLRSLMKELHVQDGTDPFALPPCAPDDLFAPAPQNEIRIQTPAQDDDLFGNINF